MSEWAIRVPYRDRDDSLVDVIDAAMHFSDQDERATIREISMRAHLGGMRTAGDLLDHLEGAGRDGRRQILESRAHRLHDRMARRQVIAPRGRT